MFYIVLSMLLFIASVIVHIFFCRKTTKSGLQARAFIFISVISMGIYMTGVLTVQHWGMFDPHSLWGFPFRITAGLILILLVPIYLCFYVLTQLTSPSKKILLAISQCGQLSRADILLSVQKEDFIMTRLNDLCTSGCVKQINGRYILTWEGRKIAVILNFMQSVLGRNAGG